jgi:hypothetical protein
MTKLKPVTPTSWIVYGDTFDTRMGLLTETIDQYVLMIKGIKKHFKNKKEVTDYFKEDIFDNVIINIPEQKIKSINGYPVAFDDVHEILINGNTLPLFNKKPSSVVYYAAGYYVLKFPKSWIGIFCPKYSTLQQYEYYGPFFNEIEMKNKLSMVRKDD